MVGRAPPVRPEPQVEGIGGGGAPPRFDVFVGALARARGQPIATGVFGAVMQVALVNDGPVTIWLDSRERA